MDDPFDPWEPQKPRADVRPIIEVAATAIGLLVAARPMSLLLQVGLLLVLAAMVGDLSLRSSWVIHLRPAFRWSYFVLAEGFVIWMMWAPIQDQYRIEYVHDTFPFLSPNWNPEEQGWVLTLEGMGSRNMHNVEVTVRDVNHATISPGPITHLPNSINRVEVIPSDKSTRHLQVTEIEPFSQTTSGNLIIFATPAGDRTARFQANFQTEKIHYEEFITAVRKPGGDWARRIRMVDITHHLNLLHCHDPEVKPPPTRLLKDDLPCANGLRTQISPWESWQKEPNRDGDKPF
jgi:hypothetical protein